jgi:glycosyltransferase involved in cell wall biosynthesis
MEKSLRAQAGEAVEFVISPSDEELGRLMAEAEALLFPGVEDFGMIAVEAMAAGTPVIAYGAGGARDFIVPGHTGVFFTEATAEALAQAILGFDREQFGSAALVEYAAGYGQEHFLKRMRAEIEALMVGGSER